MSPGTRKENGDVYVYAPHNGNGEISDRVLLSA